VHLDFVITKATLSNGIKVATELMDAQEEPSVVVVDQPSFVTHTFTRRPDDEVTGKDGITRTVWLPRYSCLAWRHLRLWQFQPACGVQVPAPYG